MVMAPLPKGAGEGIQAKTSIMVKGGARVEAEEPYG